MTCVHCHRAIEDDSTYCRFCGTARETAARGRLWRLPHEGRIAGVCAGLAHYLRTDVTLVRLAWIVLSIVPGAIIGGVAAYVAAWVLMPESAASTPVLQGGRRLLRPQSDRKIAGVCGAFASYFSIDVTAVRLLWVVLSIYPGAVVCGILAYLVAWFIIPSDQFSTLEPAHISTPA